VCENHIYYRISHLHGVCQLSLLSFLPLGVTHLSSFTVCASSYHPLLKTPRWVPSTELPLISFPTAVSYVWHPRKHSTHRKYIHNLFGDLQPLLDCHSLAHRRVYFSWSCCHRLWYSRINRPVSTLSSLRRTQKELLEDSFLWVCLSSVFYVTKETQRFN